jgi:hypothetical protein
MVPAIALVKLLPATDETVDTVSRFLINAVLFPALSACSLLFLTLSLMNLGFSPRVSVLAAVSVGLGTIFWHYARNGQEENLVSFAYAMWLYGMSRVVASKSWGLLYATAGLCLAIGTRPAAVIPASVLFVFSVWICWSERESYRWCEGLTSLVVSFATCGLLMWYNIHRFGSPFQTGYFDGAEISSYVSLTGSRQDLFAVSRIVPRLPVLIASPGVGLLVYSPLLVLCLLRGAPLSPATTVVRRASLAAFFGNLIFYASFVDFGGYGWGPRYLAASIILLAPTLASVLKRYSQRKLVSALIVASSALQLASVALPSATEHHIQFIMAQKGTPCGVWQVSCAPVILRGPLVIRALKNSILGDPGKALRKDEVENDPEELLRSSDYQSLYWWPFRVAFRTGVLSRSTAFVIVVTGLVLSMLLLRRLLRAVQRFSLRNETLSAVEKPESGRWSR